MPTFTPFNCFTPTSSSPSHTALPTRHPREAASSSTLSHQHRNNGYEDLTLHLTQSQKELRGRGDGDGRRQAIRDFVRGRRVRDFAQERVLMVEGDRSRERVGEGVMVREAGGGDILTWGREVVEAAERRVVDMTGAGNQMVQVRSVPKDLDDEDEISELELDGGVAVGVQQIEPEVILVERGRVVVAGQERGRRLRDHCTPGERQMVEEWIAACESARCKGFVKHVRGRTESDERFEDAAEVEGEVNVRGGGDRPGWPEWGLGWGAASFMK